MKRFIILALITLSAMVHSFSVASKSPSDLIFENLAGKDKKTIFQIYHYVFNKNYDINSEEGLRRFKNFKNSLNIVNIHNQSHTSYKKGINHLSDMTTEEIKAYYNLVSVKPSDLHRSLRSTGLFKEVEATEGVKDPQNVDWTSKMRPVRNQGGCGSCWAFTTMSVVEGHYNIKVGPLTDWFSTQQLVDCDLTNNGCNGGWFSGALKYLVKNAPVSEADYPYKGVAQSCGVDPTKSKHKKATGYNYSYMNKDKFNLLLSQGPVAVAVEANEDFMNYSSGVWDAACTDSINHAVTLVGFGEENQKQPDCTEKLVKYFLIRNSWGERWGEKGHIKIKYNPENSDSCNIHSYGYVPAGFQ
jgi:xylem cysteine proteinase